MIEYPFVDRTRRYTYKSKCYLVTPTAYENLVKEAREYHFIQSQNMARGLSTFINCVNLKPNFTDMDLEEIEICKKLKRHHQAFLNGEYRYARQFALSNPQIDYLATLGLKFALWQKQPTKTSLVSGTLEAWGNGKFIAEVDTRRYEAPIRIPMGSHKIELTWNQLKWLEEQAMDNLYVARPNISDPVRHRGFNEFIKDFAYVEFKDFPFNVDDPNPHFTVPPLPLDDVIHIVWRTSPLLQGMLDRTLWVPELPYWHNTRPYYNKFDYSIVEEAIK